MAEQTDCSASQTLIPESMMKTVANGHRRSSFFVVENFQDANQFSLKF
jgi:hypothetical protein